MAIIRNLRNEPPDDDTLGGRLSRTRDALGISVPAIARRVGVPPGTILAWESDRSEPNVERLSLLANILNVNLVWLLHGVGDAPADEIGPDPLAAISLQLERLRRIHEDTGQIIERLHREIERLNRDR